MKKGIMTNLLYVGGIVGGAVTLVGAIIGHKKNSSRITHINDDDNDDYIDGTCEIADDDTTEI